VKTIVLHSDYLARLRFLPRYCSTKSESCGCWLCGAQPIQATPNEGQALEEMQRGCCLRCRCIGCSASHSMHRALKVVMSVVGGGHLLLPLSLRSRRRGLRIRLGCIPADPGPPGALAVAEDVSAIGPPDGHPAGQSRRACAREWLELPSGRDHLVTRLRPKAPARGARLPRPPPWPASCRRPPRAAGT
jgi:hypothetical protein